ncbi:hypothetical protein [Oricola indica]|jgi:arginase family enzyme|uniref:hypothetical protein n=1 Tax=Oricola indica TaxID=2872591 RepID=UPI003D16801B
MAGHGYESGRLDLPFVGIDLVEGAPDYDPSGLKTTLAAQLLLNVIGRVLQHRF